MSALVGRRYAQALFDIAKEQKKVEEFTSDCETISLTLKSSKDLSAVIKNPVINHDKKIAILDGVFRGKISNQLALLLKLLVQKGRAALILDVTSEFQTIIDEQSGIIKIDVHSAVSLDEQELSSLSTKLESYTGKKVRLTNKIDKQLLGGFTARLGDTVIDGSVKHKLERLKEELRQVSLN